MENTDIKILIGKTFRRILVDGSETAPISQCDNIIFETDSETFEMYHMQDCCETVVGYDIHGSLESLLNHEIIFAQESVDKNWPIDVPQPIYIDSFTWTTFTLRTENSEVIIRWLGQSNGYYSESVYVGRAHKHISLEDVI